MMKKNQTGMTLLEVMVALAVFAIAGLAVLGATNHALQGQMALEEKTFATWIAENQLVEIKLQRIWPNTSWQDKRVTLAQREWYVRWQGVETPQAGLRALDVEVSLEPFRPDKTPAIITSIRTYIAFQ